MIDSRSKIRGIKPPFLMKSFKEIKDKLLIIFKALPGDKCERDVLNSLVIDK